VGFRLMPAQTREPPSGGSLFLSRGDSMRAIRANDVSARIAKPIGGRRGQRAAAEQQREEEAEAGQEEAPAGAFSALTRSARQARPRRRAEEVATNRKPEARNSDFWILFHTSPSWGGPTTPLLRCAIASLLERRGGVGVGASRSCRAAVGALSTSPHPAIPARSRARHPPHQGEG